MAKYQQTQSSGTSTSFKAKLVFGFLALFMFIALFSTVSVTIGAGQAGVLFKKFDGGVDIENVYSEGFHTIAPWNKMIKYEVRQQEVFEKMGVLSSNGLEIALEVSAWYQPQQDKLALLHKEKGRDYLNKFIKPAMRSASRSVIGRYTPEELYSSKREAIQHEIEVETKKILEEQYVELTTILVRDITLPPTIKTAIEGKLKQEQEALEYEFKLQKAKKEAEKVKIEAEGKAEANRILNASLTPNILKEKGIEATLKLAKSPNAKVVVVGGADGLPLILGEK